MIGQHFQQPQQGFENPERRDTLKIHFSLAGVIQAHRRQREEQESPAEQLLDLALDLPARPDRVAKLKQQSRSGLEHLQPPRLARRIDLLQSPVERLD